MSLTEDLARYELAGAIGEFDLAELIRSRVAARRAPSEEAERILTRYGPDVVHLAGMIRNAKDAKDLALTYECVVDLYGRRTLVEALRLAGRVSSRPIEGD
jgi:hypothetical protein